MTRICRFLTATVTSVMLVAASCLGAPATMAQAIPVEAFYGHFQGSGVAENSDSLYFGITVRDLDVKIGAAERAGFYVEWTSVIRSGSDPKNPSMRRSIQHITFTPGDVANVFAAVGRQDPRSEGLAWAQIQDNTMSVHLMQITAVGGYEIQTYSRTLEAAGMRLKFTNVANGQPRREVDARLVKVGK